MNTTQGTDATTVTANAGDTIRYTLNTKNVGPTTINYQVSDQIDDILEYANVIDSGGGVLDGGTITWPTTAIDAGDMLVETFTVRVKDPIPSTPIGVTDSHSFDLRMDNIYGNDVHINVHAPLPKQIEQAASILPNTGPTVTTLIILVVAGLVLFFYFRNRQLLTEVKHLRSDYDAGGN
jgi:uncharacterized repeat protein (TIGR01451 family)/LPXTG-motif cell wall-anchored protein